MPRSYVTNLHKGRIESPGYEKIGAIVKAMGFSPEAWFEENFGGGTPSGRADESSGMPGRLGHLFELVAHRAHYPKVRYPRLISKSLPYFTPATPQAILIRVSIPALLACKSTHQPGRTS